MAPHRIEVVGGYYHVNANSVEGTKLFADDYDRQLFLELFAEEVHLSDWSIFEYTLLTTHFHALIRLQKLTLSSGFRRLNSRYARAYNRARNRRGVLWQKRFHGPLIESEAHLYESVRYIARNAPRANICDLPQEWAWCSYGASVGFFPADPIVDDEALLGLFGTSPKTARRALRAFVDEEDPRARRSMRLGLTPVRPWSDA
jgi:putative transposase